MIGPDGMEHYYPAWLFEQLKRMDDNFRRSTEGKVRLLRRDSETGLWAIQKETITLLLPLWELPAFNPHARIHAIDPFYSSGKSRDSGRRGLIDLLMTGTQQDTRKLQDNASELDDSRMSAERTRQIVREVKSKRRVA